MFDVQSEPLGSHPGLRKRILGESKVLSYRQVITLWQRSAEFRSSFIAALVDVPFPAFRWETPPVTRDRADHGFEFAVLPDPSLDRGADSRPFAEHFADTAELIATFPNLGGDAILVVPYPAAEHSVYSHLGLFARSGPVEQNHALWASVGRAMERTLSDAPIWLSTAGTGIPWLHIRLDSRPKYYRCPSYRTV